MTDRPRDATPCTIAIGRGAAVSGLLLRPVHAHACFVFAHGAGAGMRHAFIDGLAHDLAARGVATLRYQFPYMERGARRPDPPAIAHAAVRAAVAQASALMPGASLFAGGKSFGGRMTSQAQAAAPLPGVRGIAFVGFPLHAAGRPADERAAHLFDVHVPMFFLQGDRDDLAHLDRLRPVVAGLGRRAELEVFEGADHAFHVRRSAGRSDDEVRRAVADALARWIDANVDKRSD